MPRSSTTYQQWQDDMERVYGLAELIVAKQRHGSTGKVKLKFEAKITRFSDCIDEGYLPEVSGADLLPGEGRGQVLRTAGPGLRRDAARIEQDRAIVRSCGGG